MFCTKCGTKNDDQAKFCISCGHELTLEEEDASPTSSASRSEASASSSEKPAAEAEHKDESSSTGSSTPSAETSASPSPQSEKLGPFILQGELGRGAMARVWRAFDPNLEREVAIKEPLFDQNLPADVLEEMGRRFVKEGRAAAKLDHNNIVTIYAADVYDGRPAIVMELVEGATLNDLLDAGPLNPEEALSVLDQLLDAVGYAHQKGIVHRDIKPDNIFVSSSGVVKLADFGIAHIDSSQDGRATMVGTVLGTPGYMSPEQATGKPVDARSDLFSVATVGYEMLCGYNPFNPDGADATTLLYRIVHEPVPELSTDASYGLPSDMRPALMAALSKDPAYRPQNAASFKAMLHGAQSPTITPVQGTDSPLANRVARTTSGLPKWLPYAAIAILFGAILLGILASTCGNGGATSTAPISASDQNPTQVIQNPSSGTEAPVVVEQPSETTPEAPEEEVVEEPNYPPVFTATKASSELKPEKDKYFYYARFVLDGDTKTAWVEGAEHTGENEWIEITADKPQLVSSISIAAGYQKDEDIYKKNARPHKIRLSFDDGSTIEHDLEDKNNAYQDIDFGTAKETKTIRITILSVYEGSKYKDCCISEIKVK